MGRPKRTTVGLVRHRWGVGDRLYHHRIMDQPPSDDVESDVYEYVPHVGATRQYVRDIILGVNDGLVSTFLLVAGVVGAGLTTDDVLLTAIAGAIAGAVSMAAGEFLATRSQEEVFDSEIALERQHISHFRAKEVAQLQDFFEDVGIAPEDMETTMAAFSRNDRVLLNTMKVFEFGIVDSERRSPYAAMIMSGLLFFAGALPSTVPFAFVSDVSTGLWWAAALSAIGLIVVGVLKTTVTRTNPVFAGFQNLAIAGIGGVVAYGVGAAFGAVV